MFGYCEYVHCNAMQEPRLNIHWLRILTSIATARNDLDVWLIDPQMGCALDEDLSMHDQLFSGMVSTIEHIWRK
jgi:hypothetical protein